MKGALSVGSMSVVATTRLKGLVANDVSVDIPQGSHTQNSHELALFGAHPISLSMAHHESSVSAPIFSDCPKLNIPSSKATGNPRVFCVTGRGAKLQAITRALVARSHLLPSPSAIPLLRRFREGEVDGDCDGDLDGDGERRGEGVEWIWSSSPL